MIDMNRQTGKAVPWDAKRMNSSDPKAEYIISASLTSIETVGDFLIFLFVYSSTQTQLHNFHLFASVKSAG